MDDVIYLIWGKLGEDEVVFEGFCDQGFLWTIYLFLYKGYLIAVFFFLALWHHHLDNLLLLLPHTLLRQQLLTLMILLFFLILIRDRNDIFLFPIFLLNVAPFQDIFRSRFLECFLLDGRVDVMQNLVLSRYFEIRTRAFCSHGKWRKKYNKRPLDLFQIYNRKYLFSDRIQINKVVTRRANNNFIKLTPP